MRGEGAHLIDRNGYRFAKDFHPDGELAPRDVVSRAIFHHLQHIGDNQVWLDMRPIAPDRLQYRFPNIIKVCRTWGCDPLTQPVPVAPAAHYWMGGITTDIHSQTTIPRLFAVGENASTGVHGANRLASNSLLECLVYGAELEHLDLIPGLVQDSGAPSDRSANPGPEDILKVAGDLLEMAELSQQREELNQLMWDYAAISRTQSGLEKAIRNPQLPSANLAAGCLSSCPRRDDPPPPPANPLPYPKIWISHWVRAWGELRNLYDIAWLILNSAALRTESRGGHFREDHPHTDPQWRVHTLVKREHWEKSEPLEGEE